jgi:hypothetical protein
MAGRLSYAFAGIARWTDRIVNLLKWPTAIVALIVLPKAALALLQVVRSALASPKELLPLFAGLGGYLLLWRLLLRRRPFGAFFSTLEHELTHALFALATFHPVTGLWATFRRGGRMSFRGDGNWLITIAPYFFPTSALAVLLVSSFLDERWRSTATAVLGAALGYHLTSTYEETHAGQTDLKLAGWVFSVMFLPAANLISLGAILSFAAGGTDGLLVFLRALK